MNPVTTAVVVIRPEEGRRLIGMAVALLPQVQTAARSGRLVIVGGSTTRHVVRSLTLEDPGVAAFAIGWICHGELGETPRDGRGPGAFLFEEGQPSRGWPGALLARFGPGDCYIKGANAIDPQGNAAILMGSPNGGTIGAGLPILMARGGELILPVSLQKLIPSVPAACNLLGQGKVGRQTGSPVGWMPILAGSATLVTEVEALAMAYQVRAVPVAAGGVGDCEGAIVLHLSGSPEAIEEAWQGLQVIRREAEADPHQV